MLPLTSAVEKDTKVLHNLTAEDLTVQLDRYMEAVRKITSFKRDFKGESIKVLKEVVTVVGAASKEVAKRRWRQSAVVHDSPPDG